MSSMTVGKRRVYLSFPKNPDSERYFKYWHSVLSHFFDVSFFLQGGRAYRNPAQEIGYPDFVVIYIKGNNTIGRGSYEEYKYALDNRIPIVFAKGERLFLNCKIIPKRVVEDWNTWADVEWPDIITRIRVDEINTWISRTALECAVRNKDNTYVKTSDGLTKPKESIWSNLYYYLYG